MSIAVYPGTFDPITNGHLDIVKRAARLFDGIVMGVYEKSNKHLIFTTEERVELARRAVAKIPNVEVKSFSGLTVDFARGEGARVMIRGLRMNADFEKEFEMALMNRKLAPDLDLLCLMASQEYQFLSSSLLKEVARLNGNISDLVPKHVAEALRKKVHDTM
ncbi:MAG: phosphopantetheine adenylyltransferase [Dehalococcoidia bacterium SG8_51_3]|nr:MAG: phosphopantetheine adenylyltransferase [Dehalococcoidia bacterium SG8_51_3]